MRAGATLGALTVPPELPPQPASSPAARHAAKRADGPGAAHCSAAWIALVNAFTPNEPSSRAAITPRRLIVNSHGSV